MSHHPCAQARLAQESERALADIQAPQPLRRHVSEPEAGDPPPAAAEVQNLVACLKPPYAIAAERVERERLPEVGWSAQRGEMELVGLGWETWETVVCRGAVRLEPLVAREPVLPVRQGGGTSDVRCASRSTRAAAARRRATARRTCRGPCRPRPGRAPRTRPPRRPRRDARASGSRGEQIATSDAHGALV